MRTMKLSLIGFAIALGSAPALAQQAINFDNVTDKTDIQAHYAGLLFACDGSACASPKIFARNTATTASLPNSVTPVETGVAGVRDYLTGRIRIDLEHPASSVSIDARSLQVPEPLSLIQHAVIIAQDGSGNTIGQAVGATFGTFETLTVATATGVGNSIKRVYLGVENGGTAAVAQFDNLHIDRVTIPIWHRVPPWVWALIAAGGFILVWRLVRKP